MRALLAAWVTGDRFKPENGRLIVAAVNALPALLDAAERLAEAERLIEGVEHYFLRTEPEKLPGWREFLDSWTTFRQSMAKGGAS